MEQNHPSIVDSGLFEPGRLCARADDDSIVDRLFALPAADEREPRQFDAGVVRRLEKVLADRIRARIGGRGSGG